jgi:hypothetical protein
MAVTAAAASQQPGFFGKIFSCCRARDKAPEEEKKVDEKARQIQELRDFFRELGIYMLMLLCFSLSIWLDSQSSQKYNLAQIFARTISAQPPTSIDAFYSMFYSYQNSTGGCTGILCTLTAMDYFASDNVFTQANQSAGSATFLGNVLLGQIRLRQVRVQQRTCSSFYQKLEATNCFPDYAVGAEETTYTKEWAPDFDTSVDKGFIWQSKGKGSGFWVYGKGCVLQFAGLCFHECSARDL